MRNRIIEYLEAASDQERLLDNFGRPLEVIEKWADSVQPEWLSQYGPPIFSSEEVEAIRQFQAVWEGVADAICAFDDRPENILTTKESQNLATAATIALGVFARRGKFSEDHEVAV